MGLADLVVAKFKNHWRGVCNPNPLCSSDVVVSKALHLWGAVTEASSKYGNSLMECPALTPELENWSGLCPERWDLYYSRGQDTRERKRDRDTERETAENSATNLNKTLET